ncbi:MAG: 4,5-DOPA dioxygenase extradiol [Candidatus Eremiobacteraeota bacterium]|nr:4,5-DOPA dioxygenase extradiol [Candidatus Eremiobacteraeota bacterium]
MPAFFVGHGNPMNAVESNQYTQAWSALVKNMARPRAVLAISAHWYVPEVALTAMQHPRTIHDFGGFPPELYRIQYPAPGDPELVERVAKLLSPLEVRRNVDWGLDHGTWSVLRHMFPNADVPIVQLSIDETQPPRFRYDVGSHLAELRDEGVQIIGSGNLIHNLHAYAWGRHPALPFDWALQFEKEACGYLRTGKVEPLIDYQNLGRHAALSIPTPDHYLPLLYVIALRRNGDEVSFPVEGMDGGSISMLSVRVG